MSLSTSSEYKNINGAISTIEMNCVIGWYSAPIKEMKIETFNALRIEKALMVKKKQLERRNNLRRSYMSASRNGAISDLKKLKVVIAFSLRRFYDI